MERDVLWAAWDEPGLQHLRLTWSNQAGVVADGMIVGMEGDRPFRARYVVRCDARWRVRAVQLDPLDSTGRRVELSADGEGRWTGPEGDPIPVLDGCLDVDISATPFTNTLPIRRLALRPGQSADLAVAYIAVPSLEVTRDPQRYTCLDTGPAGGRCRYDSLDSPFTAELPVDPDGLVLDYPELFRRVWPL
jgi:hypothetical protein